MREEQLAAIRATICALESMTNADSEPLTHYISEASLSLMPMPSPCSAGRGAPSTGQAKALRDVANTTLAEIAGATPSFSEQYMFRCAVQTGSGWQRTVSLVDTGASGNFVNPAYAKRLRLSPYRLASPIRLSLADGKVVGSLDQAVEMPVKHGSHSHNVICFLANVKYDIILGMSWLDHHAVIASFGTSRSLCFNSDYCLRNCLADGLPEVIYSDRPPDSLTRSKEGLGIDMITAEAAYRFMRRSPEMTTWLEPHHFDKLKDDQAKDCNKELFEETHHLAAVTQEDFKKFMDKMDMPHRSKEEIIALLPEFLHSRWKAFDPREADKLPPRRKGVDHAIDLDPSAGVPRPHIYGLTRQETTAVKVYLDDMIQKGFVRPSTSPFAAPVLVVKKPQGGLRVCVDYRGINNVTRKNRNAPPAIKETLAQMNKVRLMSIIDVIAAFNAIRIKDGDEEKTAFLTRYGLYEYLVMPFGLCNAPGTFQNFINDVLRDLLDKVCSAYMDDVLVYSEKEEEHEAHVLAVVDRLHANGLFIDVTKCRFKTKKVKYLGLIITTDGIEMDPQKVQALLDWQLPRCLKDVQAFLGFANFYRRFILGFSAIAKPLTELVRKDTQGVYPLPDHSPAYIAFEKLKEAFTKAPVLAHFDPDLES